MESSRWCYQVCCRVYKIKRNREDNEEESRQGRRRFRRLMLSQIRGRKEFQQQVVTRVKCSWQFM